MKDHNLYTLGSDEHALAIVDAFSRSGDWHYEMRLSPGDFYALVDALAYTGEGTTGALQLLSAIGESLGVVGV